MIYEDIITRGHLKVRITTHAIMRAKERIIYPEMIEATIKGGKMKYFGKNYVKFSMNYKRGAVVCIGEKKMPGRIEIFTVEWG